MMRKYGNVSTTRRGRTGLGIAAALIAMTSMVCGAAQAAVLTYTGTATVEFNRDGQCQALTVRNIALQYDNFVEVVGAAGFAGLKGTLKAPCSNSARVLNLVPVSARVVDTEVEGFFMVGYVFRDADTNETFQMFIAGSAAGGFQTTMGFIELYSGSGSNPVDLNPTRTSGRWVQ